MAWTSFQLGRPGSEITFDVNPAAMRISEQGVVVRQRNLAGDRKKSVLKKSAPTIQIDSTYLTKTQRDQIASMVGISNTFLSFKTRDDWKVWWEYVDVLTTTSVRLKNSSASRLSAVLVGLGLPSQITIVTPFQYEPTGGLPLGEGGFGEGGLGYPPESFDPGTVSYDDLTRIVSFSNPLPDALHPVYVSYTHEGWLVDLETGDFQAAGGWIDRFQYSLQLVGA